MRDAARITDAMNGKPIAVVVAMSAAVAIVLAIARHLWDVGFAFGDIHASGWDICVLSALQSPDVIQSSVLQSLTVDLFPCIH